MPDGSNKLLSLLRQTEFVEREAGREVARTLEVFQRRSEKVEELLVREREVLVRIQKCQRERQRAVCAGKIMRVQQFSQFETHLREQWRREELELRRAQEDLLVARTRLEQREEAYRQSMIERKKIEQILAQRSQTRRVVQYAREEVSQEDLVQSMIGEKGKS